MSVQINTAWTNKTIPDSHYTPQTLSKELAKHGVALTTGLPHEWKLSGNSVVFKPALKELLGYNSINNVDSFRWKTPHNYEIHCDLVHTRHNGAPSHLMAQFSPKGDPFDVVTYNTELEHDLADFLVSQFHIAVKVDGELVKFHNKISLVLEFI